MVRCSCNCLHVIPHCVIRHGLAADVTSLRLEEQMILCSLTTLFLGRDCQEEGMRETGMIMGEGGK